MLKIITNGEYQARNTRKKKILYVICRGFNATSEISQISWYPEVQASGARINVNKDSSVLKLQFLNVIRTL